MVAEAAMAVGKGCEVDGSIIGAVRKCGVQELEGFLIHKPYP